MKSEGSANRRMKVAVIIPALKQMGPVVVMQTLVSSLSKNENLQLGVFYIDEETDPMVRFSAPMERLDSIKFPFEEYDIVHTNGIRPDYFAWKNRKKIKYHISTIHNFVFEDLRYTYNSVTSLIFGYLWLMLWRRADKLVCVSGSTENYYKARFDSSKLEIVHNGIGEIDLSTEAGNDVVNAINEFRKKGYKIIGSAGILTKIKGIDQVLKFIEKEKDCALIILGDGKELIRLQRLTKKLNISDRCYFCGFRTNAINYFKYLDLFIMPSRSEGFGLTLVEAVQQKIPVICSDIEVFKELFNEDEVTYFKLNDLDSLQKAYNEALRKGADKTELAYSRYQGSYTDKIMSEKYLKLYLSV